MLYAATPPAKRVVPPARDLEPAYPMALLEYVNCDLRIANALHAETPMVRFAFDRPGVVMLSNGFERARYAVRGITAFDIVYNGLRERGGRSRRGTSGQTAAFAEVDCSEKFERAIDAVARYAEPPTAVDQMSACGVWSRLRRPCPTMMSIMSTPLLYSR